jgi:TPR repeat protein
MKLRSWLMISVGFSLLVAVWFFTRSAKGEYDVGLAYYSRFGVSQDKTKAIAWFQEAAGRGYSPVTDWTKQAASEGYAPAEFSLGLAQYKMAEAYKLGDGVSQDDIKAEYWYKIAATGWVQKAAEQGYAPAEDLLGIDYINGEGVPQDEDKATALAQKAANQGYAPGEFVLGIDYTIGRGIAEDDNLGKVWIQKAHDQGYSGY